MLGSDGLVTRHVLQQLVIVAELCTFLRMLGVLHKATGASGRMMPRDSLRISNWQNIDDIPYRTMQEWNCLPTRPALCHWQDWQPVRRS